MNTILTTEKYGELKSRYPRFNEPWSQQETEHLREMAENDIPYAQMAQELERSTNSIKMKLKSLGLYSPKPSPTHWTEEDDRHLVDYYLKGHSFETLSCIFGRSENAIITRLVRLRAGLRPLSARHADQHPDQRPDRHADQHADEDDDYPDIPF